MNSAALKQLDDEAPMIDIVEQAEELGLVLVTNGREIDYARPNEARPGWQRYPWRIRRPAA